MGEKEGVEVPVGVPGGILLRWVQQAWEDQANRDPYKVVGLFVVAGVGGVIRELNRLQAQAQRIELWLWEPGPPETFGPTWVLEFPAEVTDAEFSAVMREKGLRSGFQLRLIAHDGRLLRAENKDLGDYAPEGSP